MRATCTTVKKRAKRVACEKRSVACKKCIVACEERIVAYKKRNIARKKRIVECRKHILAYNIDCLIIYGFMSTSRIIHLHGDVTIAGEELQNLGICSALRAFEHGSIFIVPHLL
jgi:hypothetical protein